MATLSILGLYNYDSTVLDEMAIPNRLDRETVIDNLLMELSELEFLYPVAPFAKKAIKVWSRKQLRVWDKLLDTELYEYNAIENYRRVDISRNVETRNLSKIDNEKRGVKRRQTEEHDKEINSEENKTLRERADQTNTNSNTTTNSGADTTNTSRAAFNSGITPVEAVTATRGTSATNTGRVTAESTTENDDITELAHEENSTRVLDGNEDETLDRNSSDTGNVINEHETTSSGNIGVTTTQEMIKQERETVIFNVIDVIIRDFKQRFCLMVY